MNISKKWRSVTESIPESLKSCSNGRKREWKWLQVLAYPNTPGPGVVLDIAVNGCGVSLMLKDANNYKVDTPIMNSSCITDPLYGNFVVLREKNWANASVSGSFIENTQKLYSGFTFPSNIFPPQTTFFQIYIQDWKRKCRWQFIFYFFIFHARLLLLVVKKMILIFIIY